MWDQLTNLFSLQAGAGDSPPPALTVKGSPPDEVALTNGDAFAVAPHVKYQRGFPILNWRAVDAWIDTIDSPDLKAAAWAECELAWLLLFRDALGAGYRLDEIEGALLLSSLEPKHAQVALHHMWRARRHILSVLHGIARVPDWGKDIVILFDDDRRYFQYISYYYPQRGKYSRSSGIFIDGGCGHLVTVNVGQLFVERVLAHEMTHSYLAYLPIPVWLNEGIAVNAELRLAPLIQELHASREMLDQHRGFWHVREIREFWSGESFSRPDEGSMLSYDLARMMVEEMAGDWDAFCKFVLAADRLDSGASAALAHLDLDLGEFVKYLLHISSIKDWGPVPRTVETGNDSDLHK